jgi:hypothetical protein
VHFETAVLTRVRALLNRIIANDLKVKKELGIPDDYEVYSELIFGIPKGKNEFVAETATPNP